MFLTHKELPSSPHNFVTPGVTLWLCSPLMSIYSLIRLKYKNPEFSSCFAIDFYGANFWRRGIHLIMWDISIPRWFCQLPPLSRERNQTFQDTCHLFLQETKTALNQGRWVLPKNVLFSPLDIRGSWGQLVQMWTSLISLFPACDSNGVSLLSKGSHQQLVVVRCSNIMITEKLSAGLFYAGFSCWKFD